MLKRSATAAVVAGALAMGTAAATSLGAFDDVTFAATDVDLLACTFGDVDLLPLVAGVGTDVTLDSSFLPATIGVTDVADSCVGKKILISLVSVQGLVLESVEGVLGTPVGGALELPLQLVRSPLYGIEDIGRVDLVVLDGDPDSSPV